MNNDYSDKVIWIIGASSGIGKALAFELAGRGARIILSARNKKDLQSLHENMPGGGHIVIDLDVKSREAVASALAIITSKFSMLDSVVFLAALYYPMDLENLDLELTKQIIDVNLFGAFNVVNAVIPLFKKQKYGQIALCGSVAGFVGLPSGQPYSATKAGVINLAETLRAELTNEIDIKLINPGFVKTRLTDKNKFSMPMRISADEAATIIADQLPRRGFEIHFPKSFTLLLKAIRLLPYKLLLRLAKSLHNRS